MITDCGHSSGMELVLLCVCVCVGGGGGGEVDARSYSHC